MHSISQVQKDSTYSIRAIGWRDTATIEEETDGSWSFALSLAEGIHQFLQGSGTLDLEEDLVVVVGNLDIQVLAASFWLLWCWTSSVVGHVEGGCGCWRFGW